MKVLLGAMIGCYLFLHSQSVFADESKTINYNNQKEEVFNLENFVKEIKMVDKEIDSTCINKIPYQEYICRDVVKYKQQCETVPAYQYCHQVNDPICRTETRYENQCHRESDTQDCRNVDKQECGYETRNETECRTIPGEYQCREVTRYRRECREIGGGRQCRTIPGDIQCHRDHNGENRCVKIPPREECRDEPSRQDCRDVPYQDRECATEPSRQECRQVPRQEYQCRTVTRRECTTIPGREVCNSVPRSREVCEDNYKTVCDNIPARNVCKSVPYSENVCQMETNYRDEPYACKKTIQVKEEKIVKTHRAQISAAFNNLSEILGIELTFSLNTSGGVSVKAKNIQDEAQDETQNRSSMPVIFVKKEYKNKDQGDVNKIEAGFKFLLVNKNEYFAYLDTDNFSSGSLTKNTFTFNLNGKVDPKKSTLQLSIMRQGGKVEIDKRIGRSNITYKYNEEMKQTKVVIDLKAEEAKIGGIFTSRSAFQVQVDFSQDNSDAGEMILPKELNNHWKRSHNFYLLK